MTSHKVIDLNYLKEMSEGSNELMVELISMFLKQVPLFQEQLKMLHETKEFITLGKLAHKIKSSVAMMGMNELATDMKTLEDIAKREVEIEKYAVLINKFNTVSTEAVTELTQVLNNLKSNKLC
ncbi:MAG: Hpt domain-containing protein [Bacteroidales bacterium]|nr:Hpt domain-containing protein [Bacteroidales bacterium]MBN2750906.1 Hpt domain-containing protein [Bacteroidales bacterium]